MICRNERASEGLPMRLAQDAEFARENVELVGECPGKSAEVSVIFGRTARCDKCVETNLQVLPLLSLHQPASFHQDL